MINLILLKLQHGWRGKYLKSRASLCVNTPRGGYAARQSITLGNYNSLYLLTGSFVIQREDFEDSRQPGLRPCEFPSAAAQLALFTNGLSKYNSGKSQNSRKELLAWVEIQISAGARAALHTNGFIIIIKAQPKNNSEELLQRGARLKEWPTLKSFATSCADIIVCSCTRTHTRFSAGAEQIFVLLVGISNFCSTTSFVPPQKIASPLCVEVHFPLSPSFAVSSNVTTNKQIHI